VWGFAPSSSVAGHTSGAGLARPRFVRTHDTRRRIGPYRDDRIIHPPSLPTLRPSGGPTLRARQATRRWDGGTITPQPLGYPGVCPGAPRAPGIGVGTDRRRIDATRRAPSGSPAARRYRRRATAYQGTRAQGGRMGVALARASGRSPGVPPHKRATTGPPPLGVTLRYGARASRRPGVPPAGCDAALQRPRPTRNCGASPVGVTPRYSARAHRGEIGRHRGGATRGGTPGRSPDAPPPPPRPRPAARPGKPAVGQRWTRGAGSGLQIGVDWRRLLTLPALKLGVEIAPTRHVVFGSGAGKIRPAHARPLSLFILFPLVYHRLALATPPGGCRLDVGDHGAPRGCPAG